MFEDLLVCKRCVSGIGDGMVRDDALMGIAAPLPVLSNGLRSRVLAAAAQARKRRTQGRRCSAAW